MPNGKPGDHWYTDITHGLPTFSPEVDAAIVAIDREAADGRGYTPWDDPTRQQVEKVVDGLLEEVGYEQLAARGQKVGMSYRNLSDAELEDLMGRLDSLRESH